MNRKRLLGIMVSVLLVGGALWAQVPSSIKVIVNPSNETSSLTMDQVSKFFLKKATQWADGTKVAPVDQPETSTVAEKFFKAVHGKSPGAVKSYWQQQIFSGRAVPPPVKGSDAEVIAFVKANPGAIGYVSADAPTADVKVIQVTP